MTNIIQIENKFKQLGLSIDWFIGFFEAEGSLTSINNNRGAIFELTQHVADYNLMCKINYALGSSNYVIINNDSTCSIKIQDIQQIREIIIPLLIGRLRTIKKFEQLNLLKNNINFSSCFDKNVELKPLPLTFNWFVGFVDGDGSFFVTFKKDNSMKLGFQVQLVFDLTQYNSDELLSEINSKFFNNQGKIDKGKRIRIFSLKDHSTIVSPFFKFHILHTRKREDFIFYNKILSMMDKGEHRTKEGLFKIKSIQTKMMFNRKGLGFNIRL